VCPRQQGTGDLVRAAQGQRNPSGRRLRGLRSRGQKIGSTEEVFVNRDGEPVYIRVRSGRLWTRMVLIPV
jgi:hypothetical protein